MPGIIQNIATYQVLITYVIFFIFLLADFYSLYVYSLFIASVHDYVHRYVPWLNFWYKFGGNMKAHMEIW